MLTRNQPAQQPIANGTAGGGGGVGGLYTAASTNRDHARAQSQETKLQPTTPRKSMSMGRISSDRVAAAAAAAAGAVDAGAGPSAGITIGMSGGAPPITSSILVVTSTATEEVTAKQEGHTMRHGLGHRRVPSDGVAWRRSKGKFDLPSIATNIINLFILA